MSPSWTVRPLSSRWLTNSSMPSRKSNEEAGHLFTSEGLTARSFFWRRRFQMRSDEQTIREVHSTWIDAVNAGDLARLLVMTTGDVVFLNPGQKAIDRDGFAAKFSGAHEQLMIHCVSELREVVIVGEVAYTL